MVAIQQTEKRPSQVVAQLLDRAADVEHWERFEHQMRATGYCRQPVRLRGQVDAIDQATGESRMVYSTEPEPDRTLLKSCGNRREAVCPSCAETYRGDAYQLVAAGLRGGKGGVRDHLRRYVECAWQLGSEEHLRGLRLRRWAHTLGFRGHYFTKSRRYSTTFTALRRARHDHVLRRLHPSGRRDPWGRPIDDSASIERGRFCLTGVGYRTPGDAWLAECAAARAREQRRVAREELRTAAAGVVSEGNGL